MRLIRSSLLGVLLVLLGCTWIAAQGVPPRLEVFAEGGVSILSSGSGETLLPSCPPCMVGPCPLEPCTRPTLSRVTSSFSDTGRLVVGGRVRFTRHDALEAGYSFSPNHLSFLQGTQSLGPGYRRVDLLSFNYVHYLWARTPLQPFVTIGAGINRFSGAPLAAAVTSGIALDNGYQFAWNYGGGADVVLQRHLALRLELRDYVTGQPSFITGTSHNVVPSAGIVFRFK